MKRDHGHSSGTVAKTTFGCQSPSVRVYHGLLPKTGWAAPESVLGLPGDSLIADDLIVFNAQPGLR
jgi:hypothetical protein